MCFSDLSLIQFSLYLNNIGCVSANQNRKLCFHLYLLLLFAMFVCWFKCAVHIWYGKTRRYEVFL